MSARRTMRSLLTLSPRKAPKMFAAILIRLKVEVNRPSIATTADSSRRKSLMRYGTIGQERESEKTIINIITHRKMKVLLKRKKRSPNLPTFSTEMILWATTIYLPFEIY